MNKKLCILIIVMLFVSIGAFANSCGLASILG